MQTRLYECIFIVRQDLPLQDVQKIVERYKDLVNNMGGQVLKEEYWGLRNLAYEIKKNKKAHYIFFALSISPFIVNKLEDSFKISEDIIKFLTIKVKSIEEKPTLAIQETNEISK